MGGRREGPAVLRYGFPVPGQVDDAGQRRVTVIGDALIDEVRDRGTVRRFVGGSALNVAVRLSRLSVPSTLIAMVGSDPAGRRIRRYATEHGVALLATPSPLGSARAISERAAGEPAYTFNSAARERRTSLGPGQLEAIRAARWVVASGFPFDDSCQAEELLSAVPQPEERMILDPNPRHGLLQDRRAFCANMECAAARSRLVKIGSEDAALLYGQSGQSVAARLVDRGARAVLVTSGPRGAFVQTAEGARFSVPAATLEGPVVDTMGSGDATLASIVGALVKIPRGDSLDIDWGAALHDAMLVAAATCRSYGALLRLPADPEKPAPPRPDKQSPVASENARL